MIWAIGVAAGVGLLAGLLGLRVTFVALLSLLAVMACAVLMPAGWWPVWGFLSIMAVLFSLQGAYLAGYAIVCALARARGETADKQAVSERLNASLGGWLWPLGTNY
jgi:hypothetical protein